ncbi:spore cortex biosynthesis protein YabQ [Virgibacillus profundi]|uniref:Spore cortex biosynthesis protein YabQ n=1 Tax=Virgibacillus profundi TaxID=2024555 RepID=A0A2A2IAG5_9BACI|nr:spore cortex biosynthesis protein YabQ [Virgibacillus profundi]PAV28572.1 spore cortex biosynthesis protein YabQ [Virgibacillus profundi]PXY52745.1 spore cortex biosynthesis protein YabQ [Virgibacillus profundi]
MTLSVQFITMIAMVSSGFYLGIINDTYRRFTPYWKQKIILSYVMEICFWLTQTLLLFYVLFRVNGGELRLYVFVACLLGFAMYQVFAAGIYKRILEQIILVITGIYRFFARLVQALIITPIKWIFMLFFTIVLWVIRLVGMILLFILKLLFAPIKWIAQVIYHMLPKNIKIIFHKLAGFYSTIKNIWYKWMKYITFKRR